ncbi:hypothetical protein BDK51DRAFT_30806 [Blyttiomyces helicus]|uniref:Uncharacterized protein n=1 Tax=Blyttiomyces helicus TaxID=388810 RepID=A0A4V1IRY3_9FUNG|nr:hypothetical protein BDK51DRAFT_30806 [Blyttiomyces helicus]|eukprot:RKO91657.1 hypothetical protein BDK51DRAFT_30806 [Blyttiomyces helicus]
MELGGTFRKEIKLVDEETRATWEIFPLTNKIIQTRFGNLRTKVDENEEALAQSEQGMEDMKDPPKNYEEYLEPFISPLVEPGNLKPSSDPAEAVGKNCMINVKGPPGKIHHREKIHIKRNAAEDNDAQQLADDMSSGAGDDSGPEDLGVDTGAIGEEDEDVEIEESSESLQLRQPSHPGAEKLSSLPLPLRLSISIDESLFAPRQSTTPASPSKHREVIATSLKAPLPIKLPVAKKAKKNNKEDKPKTMKKLLGPIDDNTSSVDGDVKVVNPCPNTHTPGKNKSAAPAVTSEATEQNIAWLTKNTGADSVETKSKHALKAELALVELELNGEEMAMKKKMAEKAQE